MDEYVKLKVKGRVELKIGNRIKVYHNTIMDNALDELLKSFYNVGDPPDMLFKNVEFGDDNTANTNDMEDLISPFYRIDILSKRRTNIGVCQVRAVMLDTQPPATGGECEIKEIGLFGGSYSWSWSDLAIGHNLGTGLLISRIVVNETKNIGEQVQVTWTISLER